MTHDNKIEFEQWFNKVLSQTPVDKKQYPDWHSGEGNYEPWIPVSLLLSLTNDKVEELRHLYQQYS